MKKIIQSLKAQMFDMFDSLYLHRREASFWMSFVLGIYCLAFENAFIAGSFIIIGCAQFKWKYLLQMFRANFQVTQLLFKLIYPLLPKKYLYNDLLVYKIGFFYQESDQVWFLYKGEGNIYLSHTHFIDVIRSVKGANMIKATEQLRIDKLQNNR